MSRYADCGVRVPANDADLPSGPYRLDGVFAREREVRYGSFFTSRTDHGWRTLALDTPEGIASLTEGETSVRYTSSHGGTSSARTTRIARHEERRGGELLLGIRDAEVDDRSSTIQGLPASGFGGRWSIDGAVTGERSVAVRIDPAFAISYEYADRPDTPPVPIVDFTGQLRATADDGSTLEVSAASDASRDEPIADFTVGDDVASLRERKRYSALFVPLSVYTDGGD